MPNYDGIWELRIIYTTTPSGMLPMVHRTTLDLPVTSNPSVGTAPSDIICTFRGGASTSLAVWVDTYVPFLQALFPSTATIDYYELWKIPEGTFDATWIISGIINEDGGVVGVNSAPAQQATETFRTLGGGTARLQIMEGYETGNGKVAFGSAPTEWAAIGEFLISSDYGVLGRDNQFLIAGINFNSGQNERLWRKRYRG